MSLCRALEWDRFIQLAESEARSEPARALLKSLEDPEHWASELSTARLLQQETQETVSLLDREALWGPLLELQSPFEVLERLQRGSVLEVHELALLRRWLYAQDSWVQTPRDEIRGERFKKALINLPDPLNILRILDPLLTPEGELSEKASPRLAALYSEIRGLKREINNVLDQLLKTFSQKGVLQENFTDVRDGRYVLPIKISSQNEVDGIIYEASASRQTVFVEPKEVAQLNNRLRQRQNDLIQEIYVILESASQRILPFASEMEVGAHIMIYWDAVQAKARFGRKFSGKPIQITEDRTFVLHSTAHPLLWWSLPPESIIRNEIEFGQPSQTLLLTGPNTGGKTVLLKTLGLAGICAKTGFPFPGSDQPIVPFFDSLFADLGDSQSIEQHLSSFSGHVVKFKQILDQITDRSLILIDELNSATDPEEGAAFGRAVLETIMSKNAMIVTTTHDPHLKALAVSDLRILNASMAFDEHSRVPTYTMILGVPGRSRALETAERLGIPKSVIELAKSYLSREHNEFEKMLAKLETDIKETTQAKQEAVKLRQEAEKLRKEWTERTESSVRELVEKTRQKLRRVLEQAQDEVRTTLRRLDELKSRKDFDAARSGINDVFNRAASELAELSPDKTTPPPVEETAPQFEVGKTVRIPRWKSTGQIIEIQGSKVKVSVGNVQMTLTLADIEPVANSAPAFSASRFVSQAPAAPDRQLDLRGMRFEEAMSELSRYLDQAYRSGAMAEVTIIHGLGTGALREGTLKLLRKLPYVKEFRNGGTGLGGTGATLVEFDR